MRSWRDWSWADGNFWDSGVQPFMFMADLCRAIDVPHEVDFMTASSYGSGMSTTRDVKILRIWTKTFATKTC